MFYDFAGDPESYSSHAAVLENLVSPGCNLFFTVVDLSEEKEVITQKLGYWLTFTSFHSKSSSVRSEVVVIGSHVDVVKSLGQDPTDRLHYLEMIANRFCKKTQYMNLKPSILLRSTVVFKATMFSKVFGTQPQGRIERCCWPCPPKDVSPFCAILETKGDHPTLSISTNTV